MLVLANDWAGQDHDLSAVLSGDFLKEDFLILRRQIVQAFDGRDYIMRKSEFSNRAFWILRAFARSIAISLMSTPVTIRVSLNIDCDGCW